MKSIYLIIIGIIIIFILYSPQINFFKEYNLEKFKYLENDKDNLENFKYSENRFFPFRYFTDENNKVLPIVAVTGFFRDKDKENLFFEYKNKGIKLFGITAYKSFPTRLLMDNSEGVYEKNDTFDFIDNIKYWLCCFKNKDFFGFTNKNIIIDISESDFYNSEDEHLKRDKKYDFIYICGKDSDDCPLDGWNAFNRNFDLALKCFPILFNEYNLKGLVVGRIGCGLEETYGDNIEVVDFLDWYILQEKMRESKFLFVPNIYDASPRVVTECITKDVPVLMNSNILCGFKYINYETGEFFSNEINLRESLNNLLSKKDKISPKKWWNQNYSQLKSEKRLRNFLYEAFPDVLENVERVKFIL